MKLKKFWRLPPRSFKYRPKVDDLAPDGVPVRVAWDKFVPGSSFFIPCVNTVECVRQVHEASVLHDWTLDVRIAIENGRWGVRFWRVL